MTGQPPAFIIGVQRSGTTLLRLMLDSHPEISAGAETGFMRALDLVKDVPDFAPGRGWYVHYGLTEGEMEDRIAEFYDRIFSDFARANGKSRWIEKTPFHRFRVTDLARLFPGCQFVGVVRHAGAVLASRKKWRNFDAVTVLEDWRDSTERILGEVRTFGPDRYHALRYEDLVRDPAAELKDVLRFLGHEWSDAVLRHHEVQEDKGAPERTDGGTRTTDPVDESRIDRWVEQLEDDEIRLVRELAGPVLRRCGYREDTARDRSAFEPGGSAR